MIVIVAAALTLMYSGQSMAAKAPTGEFAGISTEKGNVNGVTYESGGVGIEERAAMDRSMHAYDLRLVFANTKGWDLAYIPVRIKTADGKVLLSEEANGPWFWVNLPAGSYVVSATYKNHAEVRMVNVARTPQSVEFTWHRVM